MFLIFKNANFINHTYHTDFRNAHSRPESLSEKGKIIIWYKSHLNFLGFFEAEGEESKMIKLNNLAEGNWKYDDSIF